MEKSNHIASEKETNSIQQILTKFLPFWPYFLLFLIVSIVGLYFYLEFTVPIFETKASVLIKDEKKGQEDSKMEEVLNVFGTKKIVENELEIFHSNSLIVAVVINLKLYAPIYEDKGWRGMATVPAYLTSPILVEVPDPNNINETQKIYFQFSNEDSAVSIGKDRYQLNEWVKTPWGLLKFSKNTHFAPDPKSALKPGKFYFQLITLDHATNRILDNLLVTAASKQSSIINLVAKDPVPARAEAIISEIVTAYNRASAERKSGVAVRTLKFIEERLKNVARELDSVEGGIQKYRDTSGVVDISEQSKLYLQNISDNDKQLNSIKMQLSALDEVESYVNTKENSGNIVPSTFNINDPSLNTLLTNLSNAESQYAKLKRTTAENNPVMLSLMEEINKTKPNILDNIRSQKNSLISAKTTLEQANDRYGSMLTTVPKKERQLVEVSRQHNTKNDIYAFLLQKREETAYSITSVLPDCYLVSNPTTSMSPISPKKPFLGILALIAPFGFTGLLIWVKDGLNGKILYRSDIEKLTRFPVIGEIIYQKQKNPIVTENVERSFIIEQFRLLRTALKYQGNSHEGVKRILITSCIKGDGKSFVSANLAVSLARSGKKVALLEMDLHQPKLSELFEIPRQDGISDYLMGKVKEEDIIVRTEKNPSLCLIPAGYLSDEPAELLANGRLEDLLRALDKQFDVLIIDTAPLKAITDAFIIAPYCNLLLNVIRHDHTPKSLIEMLDKDLAAYDIKNAAIIFNGIKNRGFGKYSYGYGHGYGYDSRSSYEEYGKKKKY